ncbi:hypothetical protein RRG08_009518 [Elysia crispata]|uniref:Uncharacterized protein n=1 Tax=Elysia crispata TaxID=231223 RepID=A0AAE1E8I3_9GAST|nr:hypothetical protein RRG08_009518 [Elysia crispata]
MNKQCLGTRNTPKITPYTVKIWGKAVVPVDRKLVQQTSHADPVCCISLLRMLVNRPSDRCCPSRNRGNSLSHVASASMQKLMTFNGARAAQTVTDQFDWLRRWAFCGVNHCPSSNRGLVAPAAIIFRLFSTGAGCHRLRYAVLDTANVSGNNV